MFITCSWILLTVLALPTTQGEQGLKTCNITNDILGECILLQLCPRAIELLKINDIKSLRSLTCGYDKLDAKVCCVTKKTDGAITFQNSTHEIATSRPDGLLKTTIKLPPDPTPTTAAPRDPPSTKTFYSTTFRVPTQFSQKHTKDSATVESHLTSIPQRFPALTIAATTESVFMNENPLGIELDAQAPNPGALLQSEISPALPGPSFTPNINEVPRPSLQYPANILPSRNECGWMDTSDKIYGGQIAGLDELPWLVRIKYLLNSRETYACHGSLITDRYVITAAHCVTNLTIIEVRLGEWDAGTEIDCDDQDCSDPPVDIQIDKTFVHPSFSKATLLGDIALLRLKTPVNFTEFIRPICLPNTEHIARMDYDLDNNYITGGWGKTEYESRPVVKRKVRLNAVPMSTCRLAIRRISNELAASTICAGGRRGEDSCAGDSGSSLVKKARENYYTNWFLFGITSFGSKNCGSEGLPGIYTRVTFYMDWLMNILSS